MRVFLGHRLPGGFRGGVILGGSRRSYRHRPARIGRVTRVATRTVVVHMSAAEYAAAQAAKQKAAGRTWAFVILGLLIAAAIAFWYVTLPVVVISGVVILLTRKEQRRRREPAR